MGIYLLNFSVDAVDQEESHIAEDLSYNDQESIAEIIVEKLLGFENAFVEYDEQDADESNQKNASSIDIWSTQNSPVINFNSIAAEPNHLGKPYCSKVTSGFTKIDSPPPIT